VPVLGKPQELLWTLHYSFAHFLGPRSNRADQVLGSPHTLFSLHGLGLCFQRAS
jgi:hypothetical protein